MLKYITTSAVALSALFTTTSLATAHNQLYLKPEIGYNIQGKKGVDHSIHKSLNAGASIGYGLSDNIHNEISLSYQKLTIENNISTKFKVHKKGEISEQENSTLSEHQNFTLLNNAYYQIPITSALTPYLTGGIGAYMSNNQGKEGRHYGFAYKVGAGLLAPVMDDLIIDIQYSAENHKALAKGENSKKTLTFMENVSKNIKQLEYSISVGARISF